MEAEGPGPVRPARIELTTRNLTWTSRTSGPDRESGRVLVSLTGTLTLESLPGAVISAIRRGQQLLRVVIGHLGYFVRGRWPCCADRLRLAAFSLASWPLPGPPVGHDARLAPATISAMRCSTFSFPA